MASRVFVLPQNARSRDNPLQFLVNNNLIQPFAHSRAFALEDPGSRCPAATNNTVTSQLLPVKSRKMTVERQPEAVHQSTVPSEKACRDPNTSKGSNQPLLQPYKLGNFELSTRMVYAPLTRCRGKNEIPQPAAAEYYSQRAFQGSFQLTEGTVVSPHGHGYPNVPGIHTEEQAEAWKPIVKAVHDKGGVFFLQLWHVGRVSHAAFRAVQNCRGHLKSEHDGLVPSFFAVYQPDDQGPVAPSAIAISGEQDLPDGTKAKYPVPRALRKEELPDVVNQFVAGARNSLAAGFDGVEIHGAHGYLLDEFLKKSTNERTDEYGGSIENRCRFVLEIVDAVIKEVGPGKAGIRLSPFTKFMDSHTDDPYEVYGHLAEELNKRELLYVHFVEPRINSYMGGGLAKDTDSIAPFRKASRHHFLAAGGFDREIGNKAIAENHADLVVYGRHWIANPDLPKRFRLGAPLNKYDRSTFYSPDQVKGYTDYPFLEEDLAKELEAKL